MSCAKQDIKTDRDDDEKRERVVRAHSHPCWALWPLVRVFQCIPPCFVAVGRSADGQTVEMGNVITSVPITCYGRGKWLYDAAPEVW